MSRIYVGGVTKHLQKAYWRAFRRGAVIDRTSLSATPQGDLIFSQVTDGGRPEHIIIKAAQVGLMVEVLQKAIDDAFEHGRLATWELENVTETS